MSPLLSTVAAIRESMLEDRRVELTLDVQADDLPALVSRAWDLVVDDSDTDAEQQLLREDDGSWTVRGWRAESKRVCEWVLTVRLTEESL